MFVAQISKGKKNHYAIFPENCSVIDDIFLLKKTLSTAQCAVSGSLLTKQFAEKWRNGVMCPWV